MKENSYREGEVDTRLDNIEDEINSIRRDVQDLRDEMNAALEDHDTRLTRQEKWMNRIIGGLIVLSVLITGLMGMVGFTLP